MDAGMTKTSLKISDVWKAIESQRSAAMMKDYEWKQSYMGVCAALMHIGLEMVTTEEEFDKLSIPVVNHKKKFGRRLIRVSRNGVLSTEKQICHLLTGSASLPTDAERQALNLQRSCTASRTVTKGRAEANFSETSTIPATPMCLTSYATTPVTSVLCVLADLATALIRNGTSEAQVASLTAALGQPGRSCSEADPSGSVLDAEPAQQAAPLSMSTNSSMISLPGAASLPSLTLQIAAFPSFAEGSPLSPSSSPFGFSFASSLPAHIFPASCVPWSPGASIHVHHEAPLSSAVHIPEVVQLQAPAHSSSSPGAAPEDVPAAARCVGSASAAEGPALGPPSVLQDQLDHNGDQPAAAQPSTSSTEGESARGGPHYCAPRRPHAPLLLLASAHTVPGYKGAHSSSGSAKPAGKGLLRRLRSPGTALPAIFATPKKVADSLKTRLHGIAYGVAKKALPSALFTQPQAERLVAGRPASEALAAEVCPSLHMPACLF